MLVACGSPHSYRVHVQTLVDIGMLQAPSLAAEAHAVYMQHVTFL